MDALRDPSSITERQKQVIQLIAAGRSNEEVGHELGISPRTAKAHCDTLRLKLGVHRRRQIPFAYRLLTGDDPLAKGLESARVRQRGLTAPRPWRFAVAGAGSSRGLQDMRQGVSLLGSSTASPLPPEWHEYEVRKVIDGLAGKRQAKQPPERRIVRRSRLLDALSASDARTILLIAPAGYGKTTLARQWLEEAGGVWVTVTEASGDIPVLARDFAAAIGTLTDIDLSRVETAL